jgi:hypothetical protein
MHRTGLRGAAYALIVICYFASSAFAQWKEKVIYSFQGGTDGAVPAGGMVFDKSGNLYGATEDGGANGCNSPGPCGTVFELSPPAKPGGTWTEKVLYVFKGQAYGDGATPEGSVIIDNAGNLYGTTGYGGTGSCALLGGPVGCGTVYELSPPAQAGDPWTEKVLYSLQGGNDGYVATGNLVFDRAGNLYGATLFGGGQGTTCDSLYGGNCGTVFELSPPKTEGSPWTEVVLHSFSGGTDGAVPNGGLVVGPDNGIYGTTFYGGNASCAGLEGTGCGTVFRLARAKEAGAWSESLIHVFTDGVDGSWPDAGLTIDPTGYLYGTSISTVFRLAPPSKNAHAWEETILYEFGNEAWGPEGPLLLGKADKLYGTTYSSQQFSGTVFELQPDVADGGPWSFDLLYGFSPGGDGGQPVGSLTFHTGQLYGTTQKGGTGTACGFAGCGAVFEVFP